MLLLQHPNRTQQAASGARCMMLASCEVTQGVGGTWATCPTLLRGIWARSRRAGFRCWSWLSALASLLLRWKTANIVFAVLSFSFQVWRYSPSVTMSLLSAPSTACQSPWACMIARSSAYAYFLEMVVGRSEIYMLNSRGARTDLCGTPFLRRRNLLLWPFPVARVKLRLPTISMIMWTMCLIGSNCISLQVR